MSLYNKVKWTLGILLIFGLIITTNLIDKNNFVRVKDSVEAIYKDRLVAKDLILKMSKAMHQKEIALVTNDSLYFKRENKSVNKRVESLIEGFEKTKLTDAETKTFKNFKKNFSTLIAAETDLQNSIRNKEKTLQQIAAIKNNLDDLAEVQITEGSRQMFISKQALQSVELFTQIEIYILVALAIIIQIIILYNPKEKTAE